MYRLFCHVSTNNNIQKILSLCSCKSLYVFVQWLCYDASLYINMNSTSIINTYKKAIKYCGIMICVQGNRDFCIKKTDWNKIHSTQKKLLKKSSKQFPNSQSRDYLLIIFFHTQVKYQLSWLFFVICQSGSKKKLNTFFL